jgi:hypothetical protein
LATQVPVILRTQKSNDVAHHFWVPFDLKSQLASNAVCTHNYYSTDLASAVACKEQEPTNIANAHEATEEQHSEVGQSQARNVLPSEIASRKKDTHQTECREKQAGKDRWEMPTATEAIELHPSREENPDKNRYRQERQQSVC